MSARLAGRRAIVAGDDPIADGIATRYADEGAAVARLTGAEDRAGIERAAGDALDILVIGGADIPLEDAWVPVAALDPARLGDAHARLVERTLVIVQACERALRAADFGSVIFLHSPAGSFSEGGWSDLTIAYHARHGLMRAIAAEWGPVRANLLVPFADTPGFRAFRARNPAEVDRRLATTAMRRVGDPVRDIGGAAVFLGSDDTRYLTGMVVHADGGASMTSPVVETAMGAEP